MIFRLFVIIYFLLYDCRKAAFDNKYNKMQLSF